MVMSNLKTPRKALTLAEMGYGINKSKVDERQTHNIPRAKRMVDLLDEMSTSKNKNMSVSMSMSSRKPLKMKNINHVQNHYLSTSKKNTNRRQTTTASTIRRAITFNTCENKTAKFDLNALSDVVTVKNGSSILTRSSTVSLKSDLNAVNSSFSNKKVVNTKGKENENCSSSKKLSIITEDSSRESSTGKIEFNSTKYSSTNNGYKNVNDTIDSLPDSSLLLNLDDKTESINITDSSLSTSLCTLFSKVNLEKDDPIGIEKYIDDMSHKLQDSITNIQLQMSLLTKSLDSQKSVLEILKTLKDTAVMKNATVDNNNTGRKLRTSRKSFKKNLSMSDSNLHKSASKEKAEDKKNKSSVVFKSPKLKKTSNFDVENSTPPSIGLRVKLLKKNAEKANSTFSTSKDITPKKTHEFYSTLKKSIKFLKTPVDKKDNIALKTQTPGTKLSKNVHRQLSMLYDP